MKSILFIILFSLIICSPFGIERLQKLKEKLEKIKKCVNEKGSVSLKNLFNEFNGVSIDKFLKDNEYNLSNDDLELIVDCRKKTIYS